MELEIRKVLEHEMSPELHELATGLRNDSFPSHRQQRSYGKQLPHFRFVAHSTGHMVGHLGVDHRVMRFGDSVHSAFGLIDLCVAESFRGRGVGSRLIASLEKTARETGVDVLILLADDPRLYRKEGFQGIDARCQWLRIDDHRNWGVATEEIVDELMFKPLKPGLNLAGPIDFLGYMF